ncbi:MAG TPA: hypothetical protein VJZ72_07495 [Candidatus Limnocylindrales bacterium]|nr:hypothetical protein [Candidatus Limnocylindrales bacterium]
MSAGTSSDPPIRRRGYVEVRWRQFRNAPRPVVRAVATSLAVAVVLGIAYLAYDIAVTTGRIAPGEDLRAALLVAYVAIVLAAGAIGTYLLVLQPTGAGGRARRSAWSAALGMFAAIPVAYLVLVVLLQVVRPVLLG